MGTYFVMLCTMNGGVIAMTVDDCETVALYNTKDEANEAASHNPLAQTYGYEVFQTGNGE